MKPFNKNMRCIETGVNGRHALKVAKFNKNMRCIETQNQAMSLNGEIGLIRT